MHLRRVLKSYARYSNETRTHLALDKDAPLSRTVKRAAFFAAQSSADCTTNMFGFDFRQAQGTSASMDPGDPIRRKLKTSHLADRGTAALEPGGIARCRFKASFVENMQSGRAIEPADLQALHVT